MLHDPFFLLFTLSFPQDSLYKRMLFSKSLLWSAALMFAIFSSILSSSHAQYVTCTTPRKQAIPRRYTSYELTGGRINGNEWTYNLEHNTNPSAQKNINFDVHIMQLTTAGLIIHLDSFVTSGRADPHKNFFYNQIKR